MARERDEMDDHMDNFGEATDFLNEAFSIPSEDLRHFPQEFMEANLASWCASQVTLGKASSWQHALATFIHEANIGLDFNHSVTEFMALPELMAAWIRGDHI